MTTDFTSQMQKLVFASLSTQHSTPFSLRPTRNEMAYISERLGLLDVKKLRFEGAVAPKGKRDWTLTATLGATVVQPCAVTTDPVNTRIDAPVERTYVANFEEPSGLEVEMPEDDTIEALPAELVIWDVMVEALDLALPLFPRSENAELTQTQFTEPGQSPMTDDDAKPFASLAALRAKMSSEDEQ